jgi:RsiW-degrading membrane proteinase PrsW (M82 family)
VDRLHILGIVGASFVPGLMWLVYFLRSRRCTNLAHGALFFMVGIVAGPLALLLFNAVELSPFYAQIAVPGEVDEATKFTFALFVVGPVEELVKFGAALIVIRTLRLSIPTMTTALAWSTAVALGFATVENWYYMVEIDEVVWHRALTLPFNHVLFSSFWGVGLFRDSQSEGRQWIILTLILAFVYHGLYDYILFSEVIHPAFVLPIVLVLYGWLASVFRAESKPTKAT